MYIWTKIQMKNTPQCQWGHIWNPRIIRVKVIYRIQKAMLTEKNLNLFYLKMIAKIVVVAEITETII